VFVGGVWLDKRWASVVDGWNMEFAKGSEYVPAKRSCLVEQGVVSRTL
jgi:hypothetical protein